MKNLVATGRANKYVYASWLSLTLKKQNAQDDNKDSNYVSQEYTINSNVGIDSYKVVLDGEVPSGTKITDMDNNVKDSFDGTTKNFKVLVPKPSGKVDINFKVIAKSKLENKAVLFGLSHNAQKQDYYVAPTPTHNGDTIVQFRYEDGTEPPDKPENPDLPTATQGLQILKVRKGTTQGLPGAVFKLTHPDGGVLGYYVTDKNGEISIPDMPVGSYYVEETVPPYGYVLDEQSHKDIVVKADEPTVVTFANEEMAELEILKVDADTGIKLSGATIRVAYDGGHDSFDVYTNASGKATLTNLKSGTYTVTEITAPEGYILNTAPQSIKLEPGKSATITLKNQAKPGLIIKKYDEDTAMPLPDAEFSVAKKGGSIVHEGITDRNGQMKLEGLEEGWYTITEIAAPKGYLIATESKDVYLEPNKVVEVKFDNRLRPSLQIMKIDAQTGEALAGAKFKVTKTEDKTVSEYVTDKTGTIVIRDLDEAVYTVEEVEALEGYRIDPDSHKDIALEWGKTKTLVFSDTRNPALEIQKIDSQTKKPLAGAKFKVTKTEDNTVSEYLTNEEGKITINNLTEGIYTIDEITAPTGYILDTQHKEIELEAGKLKTLIYENTKKPTLIVTKTNVLTQKPVPNTVFKIQRETENGGVITLGTYKTDKNGKIIIKDTEPGWYVLTETRAAEGMSKPTNPVTRKYLAPAENAYSGGIDNAEDMPYVPPVPEPTPPDNGLPSNPTPPNQLPQGNVVVTSGNDYNLGEEVPNFPLNSIVIKKTDANTSEMLAVDGVLDQFFDWIFGKIVAFFGEFFNEINLMGAELFELSWIKAILLFFSYFAWALYTVGIVVAVFDTAIEVQRGKGGLQDVCLNAIKGFFAASLFTVVPVNLYVFCINLSGQLIEAISGLADSPDRLGALANLALGAFDITALGSGVLSAIVFIILLGYTVIKVFFANLKRGGILLVMMATGSLYLFSVPRGYSDGFVQWCKQVAALCLTAFLQTIVLVAGLVTVNDSMLLGIGLALSATEVPRIAGNFGLDTSTKFNIMSSMYSAQSAVNLTRGLSKMIGK